MKSSEVVRLEKADNVVTAIRALKKGEEVEGITVINEIPRGHKLAACLISTGDAVYKYAQIIAYAACDILPGEHVHTHNVEYRDEEQDYEFGVDAKPVTFLPQDKRATFMGYPRASGAVGTRNYIAILTSVNCSAMAAQAIARTFDESALQAFENIDGVASFVHGGGCVSGTGEGAENLERVLVGYANHSNIAAVLMIGLGCEANQISHLVENNNLKEGRLFQYINIQSEGGLQKAIDTGIEKVRTMLPLVNQISRVESPVSELMLALQCGGSDAWSGITANPALGVAVDLLVAQGATAVLAETPEVYGAEHLLTRRSIDAQVGHKLLERIAWWEDYVRRNNATMDNNPSHGNKKGGLTTILEKSLGAVSKGGTTPLMGVFKYAEKVDCKGFVFMDSPGYDPCSVTGEIAAGCNIVAFTTGRGSAFGSKPSPCIKIASNSELYSFMSQDMDINAGRIITEGISVAKVGQEIFNLLLRIASGEHSLSEQQGLGDLEFVPWQVGATM